MDTTSRKRSREEAEASTAADVAEAAADTAASDRLDGEPKAKEARTDATSSNKNLDTKESIDEHGRGSSDGYDRARALFAYEIRIIGADLEEELAKPFDWTVEPTWTTKTASSDEIFSGTGRIVKSLFSWTNKQKNRSKLGKLLLQRQTDANAKLSVTLPHDADVIITCGSELPPGKRGFVLAHRLFLTLHCQYFIEMLKKNKWAESQQTIPLIIEQPSVSLIAMQQVIRFLYTSVIEAAPRRDIFDCLEAADLFGLRTMIEQLTDQLRYSLTKDNALEIMDMYSHSNNMTILMYQCRMVFEDEEECLIFSLSDPKAKPSYVDCLFNLSESGMKSFLKILTDTTNNVSEDDVCFTVLIWCMHKCGLSFEDAPAFAALNDQESRDAVRQLFDGLSPYVRLGCLTGRFIKDFLDKWQLLPQNVLLALYRQIAAPEQIPREPLQLDQFTNRDGTISCSIDISGLSADKDSTESSEPFVLLGRSWGIEIQTDEREPGSCKLVLVPWEYLTTSIDASFCVKRLSPTNVDVPSWCGKGTFQSDRGPVVCTFKLDDLKSEEYSLNNKMYFTVKLLN